jgi:putative membrane protein
VPPTPPPPDFLSLADVLALERTHLALERTLLAYLRSGLALLIGGVSLINFFQGSVYLWVGVLCLPLGLGVIGLGWARFRARQRHLAAAVAARRPG